jgi:DNA-directed RNA polymerase specialized sigma24 family protein
MSVEQPSQPARGDQRQWFAATHWSVVLAAGLQDPTQRAAAMETLCRTYWEPLYAYVRHLGRQPQDAQDLVQDFLAHLLTGHRLEGLEPAKGKFRSFLLVSLNHFLADQRDRATAAKRGGGLVLEPLETRTAERHWIQETDRARSPGAAFDRRWAMTLLNQAFCRLQEEYLAAGKAALLGELGVFLATDGNADEYAAASQPLRMTPGAVAVAVHRLRGRYRECIRAEVAQTLSAAENVDDEMRYLLEVLCA